MLESFTERHLSFSHRDVHCKEHRYGSILYTVTSVCVWDIMSGSLFLHILTHSAAEQPNPKHFSLEMGGGLDLKQDLLSMYPDILDGRRVCVCAYDCVPAGIWLDAIKV